MESPAPPLLPADQVDQAIISSDEVEMKHRSLERNFRSLVWLVLSIIVVLFQALVLRKSLTAITPFIIYAIGGFLSIIILRLMITQSQFSYYLELGVERISLTFLLLYAVYLTGGYSSPLLFAVLLAPLFVNTKPAFASHMMIGFFETAAIIVTTFIIPDLTFQYAQNPLQYTPIIVIPLISGYFAYAIHQRGEVDQKETQHTSEIMQSLLQQKNKYEEMLQSIKDGILAANSNDVIFYANLPALTILQKPSHQVIGNSLQDVLQHPQIKKKENNRYEFIYKSLEGEEKIIELNIAQLHNTSFKSTGKICVFHDISSQRQFEDMQVDFMTIAAHQFRTPVTIVRGYLEMILRSAGVRLNPDERMYLTNSLQSLDLLFALIQNLLKVSEIEQGVIKYFPQVFQIDQVIVNIMSSLQSYAQSKQVNFYLENNLGNHNGVKADPKMLSEAITQVVLNGINFNKPGGKVTISLQYNDPKIIIYVADTGRGISPEDSKFLFTKFYRASHSLEMTSSGFGVGLYIAKSIIEANGGSIAADSIQGKGSTFMIELPAYSKD